MPIYQVRDALVVHLGYGDVAISTGRNIEKKIEDELVFSAQGPHSVGEETTEFAGKSTDEIKAPLRFIFENEAAIDVLIERLEKLRQAKQEPV